MLASPALAQDDRVGQSDFGGFRNVLAVGQGEGANATELAANQATGAMPASFTSQLPLYRDLLYASPALAPGDLATYFKPAGFGVASAEVASTVSPRPGVTIVRDRTYQVPRVYGQTREDTMFGAGYASAQDRLFMMDVLRHYGRGRLGELAGAGTGDGNLKIDAEQLLVSDYSEEELQRMIDEPAAASPDGARIRQDLLAYVEGINKLIAEARTDPTKMPGEYAALGVSVEDWKPTDTAAIASLIGGIFGRGGGKEAVASQVWLEAKRRFGRGARAVFGDFRRANDPEAPVTVRRRFPFDRPGKVDRRALALPDLDSLKVRSPIVSPTTAKLSPASRRAPLGERLAAGLTGLATPSSNALLIGRQRSKSGRPLAVMGPQVGYYSPEILMEIELHGPGIDARGATFPGISLYVLIGRGQDFAWSATTATTDVTDEFVEQLCEPGGGAPTADSTHYLYKGLCREMTVREYGYTTPGGAGVTGGLLREIKLRIERTVHGPVQYRGTVRGKPVAVAEARSTYMHELDSAAAFERLNTNRVADAKSFQEAMSLVNFAFNWFYADDRDIAYIQSGWFPIRAPGTDPSLPAWGTGRYDWRGFDERARTFKRLPTARLPQAISPEQGYLVNWNSKPAPGWRAADDIWTYGSVHRSERLEDRVRAALRGGGKIDLTGLVQAMEEAATADLRGQEIYPWLRKLAGKAPPAEVKPYLDLLDRWAAAGAHRRDLDRDGYLDESAAVALMDAWWEPLVRAIFEPALGGALLDRIVALAPIDDAPPANNGSSFFSGWWGYVDKDLRTLLGRRVRGRLSRLWCGGGSLPRCRELVVSTLKSAAGQVAGAQGDPDPAKWKLPTTCEDGKTAKSPKPCDQVEFQSVGSVGTPPIPWQDRPTFQQIVEVQGHRAR